MFSLREVLGAIQSYGKAHTFIKQHKLWKWIIIPGLIYCALFFLGAVFVWGYIGELVDSLMNFLPLKKWLASLGSSFLNFLFILAGLCIRLITLLLYISFFKYFFLIVGSPLFAFLSEKTEAIMQGKDFPFNFSQFIKDIWRGIKISFRNMVYQTALMLALSILAFIPLVGLITPLVAWLVECFYWGFSMMDYSFERKQMSIKESIAFIREHKGMAVGNGLVYYILIFIPIIAPCYAVIAATIHIQQQKLK
ncbi:CysZ protein [Chitinophaga skermanii]|uniref:CysZ protein n=1 Tax=Chitinophaga skermanii TaxID=331697 RepID=A0A327R187_9BACT|nr:EI24 domain-containing protein [Chitinophaga skermanii]RAJ10619.1 CysZ protein [Chitinophaga skermanii]